jgi:hypothetical protein
MAEQFYKVIPPSPENPLGSWYTTDRANANYFGEEPPSQAEILELSGGWDVEGQSTLRETFDVSTGLDSAVYELPDAPSEDTLPEGWVQDTDQYGQKLYVVDSYTNRWMPNPAFGKAQGVPTSMTPGTQDGLGTESTAFPEGKKNALDVVRQVIASYGLPMTLVDKVWGLMKEARSPAGVAFEVRQTDEYKARFPGMQMRQDMGLSAISEVDYLALERDYRGIFRAAGLPDHFSDGPEDFGAFIAGDVSAAEVQSRVALAEQARDVANQDIVYQLKDFYDLTDGDLTAYYLNPEVASNIFEERRRMGAATLATAAARTLGTGLSKATAEAAERQSIAAADLSAALAQRAGLTADLIGSEGLAADVLVEGDLLGQAQERARVRRVAGARTAPFGGTSGALTTGAGITGLGAAQ